MNTKKVNALLACRDAAQKFRIFANQIQSLSFPSGPILPLLDYFFFPLKWGEYSSLAAGLSQVTIIKKRANG